MRDIKQHLKSIDEEIRIYFSFLKDIGYIQKETSFKKIDASGNFIPDMPYLESVWENHQMGREIVFTVYKNHVTFCRVVNKSVDEYFLINNYFKSRLNRDVGVHSMKSLHVKDKFLEYLDLLVHEFKTQLAEVIEGKKWIHVPFDWQGQK